MRPHERLAVACDRKTYLAPWQFMRPKELDPADPVLDRMEVKRRSPFREPLRNVLHDHMVAPRISSFPITGAVRQTTDWLTSAPLRLRVKMAGPLPL